MSEESQAPEVLPPRSDVDSLKLPCYLARDMMRGLWPSPQASHFLKNVFFYSDYFLPSRKGSM